MGPKHFHKPDYGGASSATQPLPNCDTANGELADNAGMKTKNIRARATAPETVHLEYEDSSARRVALAGTFNDWRLEGTEMIPLGSGKWAADLTLAPGAYEYRLLVDGHWKNDPRCPRTAPNPFGETNSLLVVPEVDRESGAKGRRKATGPRQATTDNTD